MNQTLASCNRLACERLWDLVVIRWENSLHVVLRQLAGLGEIGLLKLQSHLRERGREKVESKVSEEGKD